MRRSVLFLLFTAASLAVFFLLPLHAHQSQLRRAGEATPGGGALRGLQITDLCLSTEARYTRHPAMADHHAPFQEHPLALEHFPSGSLISPPAPLRNTP